MSNSYLAAVLAGLVLVLPGRSAEPAPLWGKLTAGPYPAGYQTAWKFDHSRRHETTFDDNTDYAPARRPSRSW